MAGGSDGSLEALCQRFAVRLLVAFGSALGDDETATAKDLDIAVAFCGDQPADVVALVNSLIALTDFEGVDVMDLDRAGPVARDRALTGTLPLYEAEAGDVARAQMAAALERMDTAWLRRDDLVTMAR